MQITQKIHKNYSKLQFNKNYIKKQIEKYIQMQLYENWAQLAESSRGGNSQGMPICWGTLGVNQLKSKCESAGCYPPGVAPGE